VPEHVAHMTAMARGVSVIAFSREAFSELQAYRLRDRNIARHSKCNYQ